MLFTRCPECETTFRVTDETLKKANGQVRCGRCASVFNAYAELHDPGAKSFEPEPAKPRAPAEPAPPATAASPAPPAVTPAPAPQASAAEPAPAPTPATALPTAATAAATQPPAEEPAAPDPAAESIGASAVADIVAEAKLAAAAEEQEAAAAQAEDDLSATEVDRVLATNVNAPLLHTAYVWPADDAADDEARPSDRWWKIAAGFAAVVLALQVLHHFRSDIAGNPAFGGVLTGVYSVFGVELTPNWDVHQYQIIDWVATAEPNSRGLGSLKITARIQNRGPLRQPFPAVQLRLKDRWETAVGSRMFTPAEYLPLDTARGQLMLPGETTRAEIEVVDPGPDTYGFELDVCIEVEASLVTCGTDEVFL